MTTSGPRLLASTLVLASSSALAQDDGGRDPEEAANLALVERAFDDWSAGRGSPFDLLAPDATWTILGPGPTAGTYDVGRLERELLRPFDARMATPLSPELHGLHADGDTVVALFEATALRRDGQPYANAYAPFFRMRDGQAVEVTAVLDLSAFDAVLALDGP